MIYKTRWLFPLILSLLAGCSSKPYIIKHTDILVDKPQTVYVVSHGWHTGFVLPSATIQERLPQLKQRFSASPYLEFGWGDKGFYQAKEIGSGLTLQAIFWPTESVIHAVAVPKRPDLYFVHSEVKTLCLSAKQYALLIEFIEQSFYKEGDGQIVALKNGIYGDSQFYKGEGDYYLMNTCNKWTAKGLNSAGFDISTTFKLTAGSVIDYLADNTLLASSVCNVMFADEVER